MAGTVDVGTLLVKYAADTKALIAGNAEATASMEATGASMEATGAAAHGMGSMVAMGAVVAGAVVVGLGVKAVKMAGDFQSSMTSLVTGAGESASNLKMVSDGILKMAVQTGSSTKDLADGMYMIESAGYHGAAGLDVLKASAEGAKVGNASLADVANGVTTAMTDYSKSGLTAAQATNTLIATVAAGKTHMADLANAMSTILPTGAAVGVSFKDVSASMATMTGEGTDAASAATYLRQLLMALASPAKAGATALKSVGLSTQEVSDSMKKSLPDTLQMITDAIGKKFPVGSEQYIAAVKAISGGSKQMQGMLELTGDHMKTLQGNLKGITDAVNKGGSAITGWATVQADFNFKLSQAKEVAEAFGIKVGTFLLPMASAIVGGFTSAAQGIGKFATYIGEVLHSINLTAFREAWNQFSTAIGHVEDAFGRLVKSINPVVGDFDPFAELIAKLASGGLNIVTTLLREAAQAIDSLFPPVQKVHAVMQPLLDNFDRCPQLLKPLTAAVKPLTDAVDRGSIVFDKFKNAGQKVGSAASEAVNPILQVVNVLKGLGQAALNMSPLVNTIEGIARHGKELGQWWQASVIPALKQAEPGFKNLGQALAGLLPVFEQVAAVVHNQFQRIFDAMLPMMKQAIPIIIQVAGVLANGLGAAIKFLAPVIGQVVVALMTFIGDIVVRVIPIIQQLAESISSGMAPAIKVFEAIWPSLSQILQGVWQQITGIIQIAWALITGMFKIALDVISGNWGQAWTDMQDMLKGVWDGIVSYFKGAWNIIQGVVMAMVNGVRALFQGLDDDLVGHSIIPDMVNGIISWFEQLPGRAGAAVQNMVNGAMNILNNMAGLALQAGANIVSAVANGITNGIGAVATAIGNVVATIDAHLPHSPAKIGPLRTLPQAGANIVAQLNAGMLSASPTLQATMTHVVAYPIRPSVLGVAASSAQVASSGSTSDHTTIVELDGYQLATLVQKSTDRLVRLKLGAKGRSI